MQAPTYDCILSVYQMDFEGHGSSDGLHVHIPNFDNIVIDCMEYFKPIRAANSNLKAFCFAVLLFFYFLLRVTLGV